MKRLKLIQQKANKRKQKDSPYRDIGAVLLFVFLLPYVIACLWGHIGEDIEAVSVNGKNPDFLIDEEYQVMVESTWGIRTMSLEQYLCQKLAVVMPPHLSKEDKSPAYEAEALKAQTVLLRTEILPFLKKKGSEKEVTVITDSLLETSAFGKLEKEEREKYEQAVYDTDGIYLSYEKEPIKAAYFALSNGSTRNANEVWKNANSPYLRSIKCGQDILAADYSSEVSVTREVFLDTLKETLKLSWEEIEKAKKTEPELEYDSAGYVLSVSFGEVSCDGETFRYAFGLQSSSFTIEEQNEEIIFHVKGVGHGFGMSQYDANQRAKQGETFDKILENYFFQVELLKIE